MRSIKLTRYWPDVASLCRLPMLWLAQQKARPSSFSGPNFRKGGNSATGWGVHSWPGKPQDALIGTRAAAVVSREGTPFDLSFQGRAIQLNPAGILRTGASEDSRIYLSLQDFE